MLLRKCKGPCGLEKELNTDNFYQSKGFFLTFCKLCHNKRTAEHKQIKKQEKLQNIQSGKKYSENGIEIIKCKGECSLEKELNENNFQWIKTRNRWNKTCKICVNNIRKEFWNENKKELNLKRKLNKTPQQIEHKRLYDINYRQENKTKIRKSKSNNKKQRIKNDVEYRIRETISLAVYSYLNKNNSSKNYESCIKHLPYTIKDLKIHIELQFEPWMNWSNRGYYDPKTWNDNDPSTWTWQLDHIIPQSDLPYDSLDHPNFLKCWSLSNLRPLSAKQNLLDGVHRTRHKK